MNTVDVSKVEMFEVLTPPEGVANVDPHDLDIATTLDDDADTWVGPRDWGTCGSACEGFIADAAVLAEAPKKVYFCTTLSEVEDHIGLSTNWTHTPLARWFKQARTIYNERREA